MFHIYKNNKSVNIGVYNLGKSVHAKSATRSEIYNPYSDRVLEGFPGSGSGHTRLPNKNVGYFFRIHFFILPPKKGKTRKNPALAGFLPARSARKVRTFADRREFFFLDYMKIFESKFAFSIVYKDY